MHRRTNDGNVKHTRIEFIQAEIKWTYESYTKVNLTL